MLTSRPNGSRTKKRRTPHSSSVSGWTISNPRSIAFQIHVLHKECAKYPGNDDHGLMPEIRRHIHEMEYRFGDPTRPDAAELEAFVELLEGFSDLLTQHFFSHSVRRVY